MTDLGPLLAGQVAVVTGAGAGIGQGIAVTLAEWGCDIVVAEIDPKRGAQTVTAVEQAGSRALLVPTDVMDGEQVSAAVAAAEEQFGRLDVLVNTPAACAAHASSTRASAAGAGTSGST